MPDFLPILEPAKGLLPLTSLDHNLREGAERIPIPPPDPETLYLLHHAGVRQAVYQGTHLLDLLCDKPTSQVEGLPPIMLYRHLLDIGDSIGTLLRFGSTSNGLMLLRSLFEGVIALEFMVKGNTLHLDRALCYWISLRIKEYEIYLKHDPSTTQGKAFHHLLDNDSALKAANFPRADHSEQRRVLERYLSAPRHKPIWERYKQARKERQSGEWYALCSNAKNVRDLAREIGREAEYALFYQQLSEIVHGTNVVSETLRDEPGKGMSIHQIRGPVTKLPFLVQYSLICLLRSHNLILGTFLRDESVLTARYFAWYRTFRPYVKFSNGDIGQQGG